MPKKAEYNVPFTGYRQKAPETPSGKVTAIICTVLGLPLLMESL